MGTKFIGRLTDVGVSRESVRGTGVAPTMWLPKTDIKFDVKTSFKRSTASYGSINQEGANAYTVQKWAEGALEMDMDDQTIVYFLLSIMGSISSTGPVDSAYTHTLSLLNSNQHPTLSITVKDNDVSTRIFRMALVNSLKLECKTGELIKVTAELISKTERDYATVTPSYTSQNKFVARDVALYLANTTAGLGAATVIRPKSITVTLMNNAKADFGLGTADPVDIYNQTFAIQGEIELNYDSETYKDLMLNGTYQAVRIKLTSMTLIGSSSVPTITIDLSRVSFEAWEPTRPNDELSTQKIQFRALYDTGNSNVVNAFTVLNGKASYTV